MKAERRHELKTNTLADKLAKAPAFFQKYGSRILLGVLVCVAAGVWGYKYFADKDEEARVVAASVDEARTALFEIKKPGAIGNPTKAVEDVEKHLTPEALKNSTDPKILATAAILRGDVNWAAANAPRPAPPTTQAAASQPAAAQPATDFLQKAADAYAEVLKPPLSSDHASLTSARLDLAAIAENRGQLDEAAKYYNLVISDTANDASYIKYATDRLHGLDSLRKQLFLSTLTSPPAPSTTPLTPVDHASPSTTAPATAAPSTTVPSTPAPATTTPASPSSSASEVSPPTTRPVPAATQPTSSTPTTGPAPAATRPAP